MKKSYVLIMAFMVMILLFGLSVFFTSANTHLNRPLIDGDHSIQLRMVTNCMHV